MDWKQMLGRLVGVALETAAGVAGDHWSDDVAEGVMKAELRKRVQQAGSDDKRAKLRATVAADDDA